MKKNGQKASSSSSSSPSSSSKTKLPIDSARNSLIESVMKHKTTIVVGETGSGKSTRLPRMIQQAFIKLLKKRCKVVCTQPRRLAAITLAKRVASEYGCDIGDQVGYSVRFDDTTSKLTTIKYVTDGVLLRESMTDKDFNQYDIIIIDEAHERSLQTDIIIGLLKNLQIKRPELKIIIMSATLDINVFTNFFLDCQVINIEGRQHPVKVLYTKVEERDRAEAALLTCLQIHKEEEQGGVLVFLAGQDEIENLQQNLERELPRIPGKDAPANLGIKNDFLILPLYSALSPEDQNKVFKPTKFGVRKFILSTNIAETSVTVSGIKYVVDMGSMKMKLLHPQTGVEMLRQVPISKSQAKQRAGRAGRESSGKCYRVYSEVQYEQLQNQSVPEIQRVHLGQVLLQLLYRGLNNPENFPFLSPPSNHQLNDAMSNLYTLDAIIKSNNYNNNNNINSKKYKNDIKRLTSKGESMARLPLSPHYSHLLLIATEEGCTAEALTVIAMLSADNLFTSHTFNNHNHNSNHKNNHNQKQGQDPKSTRNAILNKFSHKTGDFTTMVTIYNKWLQANHSKEWSKSHYLNHRSMETASRIRKQLCVLLKDLGMNPEVSCNNEINIFLKCIARALKLQCAKHLPNGTNGNTIANAIAGITTGNNGGIGRGGTTFRIESTGQLVYLHPSSFLFDFLLKQKKKPDRKLKRSIDDINNHKHNHNHNHNKEEINNEMWVVFAEVLDTKKPYIKHVAVIQKEWL